MCGRGGWLRFNRRRSYGADGRGLRFERGLQNDDLLFLGGGGGFQAIHEGMPGLIETYGGLLELIDLFGGGGDASGIVDVSQDVVQSVDIAQDGEHSSNRRRRRIGLLEDVGEG